MRDVALVPECYVCQRGLGVGAHYARQAADLFARHGIALMRHGRRTLLLLTEEFFHLADLRALQVAYLGRDIVEGRGDDRECSDVKSMAVTLNDLRRYCRNIQTQPLADLLLVLRIEMSAVAN